MQAPSRSTSELADRLGLGDDVSRPLLHAFERWDRAIPACTRHHHRVFLRGPRCR